MPSWQDVETDAPSFAARVRARFDVGTNKTIATLRKDGSPMENLGEKPDIVIPLTTEDWLTDRDPQLEKAIELLMP